MLPNKIKGEKMASFVRGANPIWYLPDLTGEPLNDEYYISYLTNVFPYVPQLVYRDNQGLVPWMNPIEFLPNGTLPDNIYFDDSLVYRLEIRHGNTQNDQLIYEINDFVAATAETPPTDASSAQENQISNPQFAFVNFDIVPGSGVSTPTLSISASGTYNIAPGWDLVLTGSGTCTVTQLIFSGDENTTTITTPPYAIRINTNGWTTAVLQQTFNGLGAIWSNTFVSMSILARSDNDIANQISLIYSPNSPGTPQIITEQPLATGDSYEIIQGIIPLPTSTDTTLNPSAFVSMQIVLPDTGVVDISDVQVMGQTQEIPVDFASTPDEPLERQVDHLFHYYQPGLNYKPIKSYLTGWDFPLNPTQELGPTVAASAIGANKSKYVWDQTIIFQSANSGVGVTAGSAGELVLTAAAATRTAIIQYLGPTPARKILNEPISSLISAKCSATLGLAGTISLWYTKDVSLPAIGSNNSIVLTLDANGKPATFNGTWFEVPRENGQNANFTIMPSSTTNFNDYGFSGWDMEGVADVNLATYFAIVVGFAPMSMNDTVSINAVSLVPGTVPTRPAPQTTEEVLLECQYYYLKTFPQGTAPGQNVTDAGALAFRVAIQAAAHQDGLLWQFPVAMRLTTPNFTSYSTNANNAKWYNADAAAVSGNCTFIRDGDRSVFVNDDQVAGDATGQICSVQAVADCRLGF